MERLELLAPAKNLQTAISAINFGADAVYIAASDFGARKGAQNSLADIKKLVDFSHLFNAKVYVTINTILDDTELATCLELIKKLYEIKVDALIIQDFAILKMALENKIPPIVLHASTQCDNRTLEKVKFFEDIGLKRVILARETPLDIIEKIRKHTNIELEHFTFGALCVSYSGQCYMSEYIGSRSANRGECAQACRKKYSLIDNTGKYIVKNKYLLSLKDNNQSKHIDKLIKAGVVSFKIEGRLKDENYVKNSTLYFNNLLKNYPRVATGVIVSDIEPNVEKTFNRGFCDDYLFNRKDSIYNFLTPKSTGEFLGTVESSANDNFVIKTKLKVNAQDGLCFDLNGELTGCLVNRVETTKQGIKIYPNKKINLKKGDKVFRNIDVEFNKALENSKTKRKLEVNFEFYENKLKVLDTNSNKVELIFEAQEKAQNLEKMKENYKKSLSKTNDTPFLVKNITFKSDELSFLPVSKINELRKEILDELKEKILSRYKVKKQKPLDISQFPLTEGDYRLNVHNFEAKEFYELCNCKVKEESFEKLKNRKNKELMRTKHCLKRALLDCKNQDSLFLEDEKGVKYPLLFDCKNCEMVILAP